MATRKKKPAPFKEEEITYVPYYVTLFFAGEIFGDLKREKLLDGIAMKYGGMLSGSGTNFTGRDYNFCFSEPGQVKKFLTYARKVKKPKKVTVHHTKVVEKQMDISSQFGKKKK